MRRVLLSAVLLLCSVIVVVAQPRISYVKVEVTPDHADWLYEVGQKPVFDISVRTASNAPVEGDDDFEAYREAAEAYLSEKKKSDEEIATRKTNLADSEARFVEFVESQGWDEKKQDAFVKFVVDSLNALSMGDVSEEYLGIMRDAFTHDEDVEEAKETGAIEARNEKITAKRIKEKTDTDGMPMGGGSSPIIEEDMEEDNSFLGGVLRDYEKRRR